MQPVEENTARNRPEKGLLTHGQGSKACRQTSAQMRLGKRVIHVGNMKVGLPDTQINSRLMKDLNMKGRSRELSNLTQEAGDCFLLRVKEGFLNDT